MLTQEAQKAAYQTLQMTVDTQALAQPSVASAEALLAMPQLPDTVPLMMDVDSKQESVGGNKRKAEDESAETHKRVKTGLCVFLV